MISKVGRAEHIKRELDKKVERGGSSNLKRRELQLL